MTTEKTIKEAEKLLDERMEIADALLVEAARECPKAFTSYVMKDENGDKIIMAPVQGRWHDHMTGEQFVVILAPRDHGKTIHIVARILYEIGRNPSIRLKIVCATDENAVDRLMLVREYILHDDDYKRVFPHIKQHPRLPWSAHKITVERPGKSKDATLEARSVFSSATGGRSDINFYDDIVDAKNAIQMPTLREMVKFVFKEVWGNLLEPESREVYIATPWHHADLTEELKTNDSYAVYEYPIIDYSPIWEAKWPEEALRARKKKLGPRAYARGYELLALSDEDILIKAGWLRYYDELPYGREYKSFVTVDPSAFRTGSKSDYCAIMGGVKDDIGNLYITSYVKLKLTFPDTIKQIIAFGRNHKPIRLGVEDIAAQKGIIDELIDKTDLPIYRVNPKGKGKPERLALFSVPVSNGKVYLKGDPITKTVDPTQKDLFDELTLFPAAEHDDLVDAICYLWQISIGAQFGSMSRLPIVEETREETDHYDNMLG